MVLKWSAYIALAIQFMYGALFMHLFDSTIARQEKMGREKEEKAKVRLYSSRYKSPGPVPAIAFSSPGPSLKLQTLLQFVFPRWCLGRVGKAAILI